MAAPLSNLYSGWTSYGRGLLCLLLLFLGIKFCGSAFISDPRRGIIFDEDAFAVGVVSLVASLIFFFGRSANTAAKHLQILVTIRKGEVVNVKKPPEAENIIVTVAEESFGATRRRDW